MKLTKNQSGFSHILLVLLLVVVLGGIGFAGYKVYDSKKAKPAAQTSNTPVTEKKDEIKKEESKIPEGFVEYENKDLGFTFAYPKEWGEVSKKTMSQECAQDERYKKARVTGDKFFFSFSKNAEKEVTIITDNFMIEDFGPVFCGFTPQVPSKFNADYLKSFKEEGKYSYFVTDDNYECARGAYYLFGVAKIQVKGASQVAISLHSVKDPGSENCDQDDATVAKTKATLNDEDQKFVKSFATL